MANKKFERHVLPLHVNGMDGRILRMPSPKNKKRQILLLYGHHASLERMYGLAEVISKHGAVTMPDLPGFGGMDSFYKIGHKPTIENYADYIASLAKLYYKRRRFTIIAMSFSVPLVIRMLQKHPEIAQKTDIFISIAGFAHKDDFIFGRSALWSLKALAYAFSFRLPAIFMKTLVLRKPIIRASYLISGNRHSKMKDAIDNIERDERIAFEIGLWQKNDVRTRMSTMLSMFKIDLCKGSSRIDVPLYHVTAVEDRYFDHKIVEQHFKIIFKDTHIVASEMANHAPTIVATAKEAAPYIPPRIRRLLG